MVTKTYKTWTYIQKVAIKYINVKLFSYFFKNVNFSSKILNILLKLKSQTIILTNNYLNKAEILIGGNFYTSYWHLLQKTKIFKNDHPVAYVKNQYWDFTCDPGVKNPPSKEGDTGSIPG